MTLIEFIQLNYTWTQTN